MDASSPSKVDLLIVGSGPVGSTYVRAVRDKLPEATILMVEVGPILTEPPGVNVRNLDLPDRLEAQRRSEGPAAAPSDVASAAGAVSARPGTRLIRSVPAGSSLQDDMPAAAMSINVGGMGVHWTCAVPRPGGSERISFIPADELDEALTQAERYLGATNKGFATTPAGSAIMNRLTDHFAGRLDRPVQSMPLAARHQGAGRLPTWTGTDVILGDLNPSASVDNFHIAAQTLARKVVLDGTRAIGVEVEDLASHQRTVITATVVVVAADALRTPQLLWASGIRNPAVGAYLNDQPQLVSAVYLDAPDANESTAIGGAAEGWADGRDMRDSLTGVCWVPFTDEHPFHGQVMQMDASPIEIGRADPAERRTVVGVGYFCAKTPSFDDRIEFSQSEQDMFGMPAMEIHYHLDETDLAGIARGLDSLEKAALTLGEWVPDGQPKLLPAGSSLHYQGTTRMGTADDGTSVCDDHSKVWGYENLFLGGNGVIPTATACNPTLTSVALAIRASAAIVEILGDRPMTQPAADPR